ncbi:hypothetical protein EVAR_61920_1 [Eumeta japonica]|uniref:Mariner Mos1 transposase n=1 Tax=Eumeta variegata TaxID=151549 RepID=A0A4C1ZMF2_EUMVA|nr:hypothetical protein EVAR_61920_1 [Eumeta japonica]
MSSNVVALAAFVTFLYDDDQRLSAVWLMIETNKRMTYKQIWIRLEILAHTPYSPDLAQYNFYLVPKIKQKLRKKLFADAEEAVATYEETVEATLKFK